MSLRKVSEYINDRLPLIVGIGMIVAIHWSWYRLQESPLVKNSERKELPIIVLGRYLKRKTTDRISYFSEPRNIEKNENLIESRK